MACLQKNHYGFGHQSWLWESPRQQEELISKFSMDSVGDGWFNFLCILDLWLLGFAKNTYKHSDTRSNFRCTFDEGLFVWQYLLQSTFCAHKADLWLKWLLKSLPHYFCDKPFLPAVFQEKGTDRHLDFCAWYWGRCLIFKVSTVKASEPARFWH